MAPFLHGPDDAPNELVGNATPDTDGDCAVARAVAWGVEYPRPGETSSYLIAKLGRPGSPYLAPAGR